MTKLYYDNMDINFSNNVVNLAVKLQSEQINAHFEKTVRELSIPPIKGELTKGKVKWRGLMLMCQKNDSLKLTYWIEQRGKQIGEKIIIDYNIK